MLAVYRAVQIIAAVLSELINVFVNLVVINILALIKQRVLGQSSVTYAELLQQRADFLDAALDRSVNLEVFA